MCLNTAHQNVNFNLRCVIFRHCVMGVFCLEYGPEAGRKHGHGAVRCHFPTGGKGGPELKALQEYIRRFLYFKNKEDYIQIEPVGRNIAGRKKKEVGQDFETVAGYCLKNPNFPGFMSNSFDSTASARMRSMPCEYI